MFYFLKSLLCCFSKSKNEAGVYILKLSDRKYYVGESTNIQKRIWIHQNENGSAWTKRYKVVKQKELMSVDKDFDELIQPLYMMNKYGVDNVRGSLFTKPFPLDLSEKIMAAQLYCELNGLCRRCGRGDHYINNCKYKKVADWVKNFGGQLEFDQTLVPKVRKCSDCKNDISSLPTNFKYCRSCFMKI